MRYTSDYAQEALLADGTAVLIRAIRPTDKSALAAGFSQLLPESRRQRFNSTKSALTDDDLQFLTECDGQSHYALVALCPDYEQTTQDGIGVVRVVRSDDDPAVAEIGITVVDNWQRRGVGRLLLEHIVAAAAERSIQRLRAVVRADNTKVLGWIGKNVEFQAIERDGDLRVLEVAVSAARQAGLFDWFLKTLRLLTLGSMIVPLRLGEKSRRRLLNCDRKPESGLQYHEHQ